MGRMPLITLDPDSPEPPFEQVREQLRTQVVSGVLAPGSKLPTVRGLAAELGIAANTVARAYRELETLGMIETRGRAGSIVTGASADRAAREAAHEYVEKLRALGLGESEAVELLRRAFAVS